jgi:hypothetical protein
MEVQRNEVDDQPQPSFINENELGACGKCESYNCFGPHQKQSSGRIEVKCSYAKRMVVTRIDITSHLDCHHFENKHSRE